jgi:hypothetical protein
MAIIEPTLHDREALAARDLGLFIRRVALSLPEGSELRADLVGASTYWLREATARGVDQVELEGGWSA